MQCTPPTLNRPPAYFRTRFLKGIMLITTMNFQNTNFMHEFFLLQLKFLQREPNVPVIWPPGHGGDSWSVECESQWSSPDTGAKILSEAPAPGYLVVQTKVLCVSCGSNDWCITPLKLTVCCHVSWLFFKVQFLKVGGGKSERQKCWSIGGHEKKENNNKLWN